MTQAAYSIDGPKDPSIPLVFDSPHSGSYYPDDFDPAVEPGAYRLGEDMDVDVLFAIAPSLGLPLCKCEFGRVYVDVNRARDDLDPASIEGTPTQPFHPTVKATLGKGVAWMATPPNAEPLYNRVVTATEIEARLRSYWDPYRNALSDLLQSVHTKHGKVFYVDCHSMQAVSNVMHEEGAGLPRADIVLGDRQGSSCAQSFTTLAAEAFEKAGFSVAINTPYQGADLVSSHGRPELGFHALQVEVNRALYMDEVKLTRLPRFDDTKERLGHAVKALTQGIASL